MKKLNTLKRRMQIFLFVFTLFGSISLYGAAASYSGINAINWPDYDWNINADPIFPAGLAPYGSIDYTKTDQVIARLKQLGFNTIRLGVNENTVFQSTPWWKYKTIVNYFTSKGMYVIICAFRDGFIVPASEPARTNFKNMWNTVAGAFNSNSRVWGYELLNEPSSGSGKYPLSHSGARKYKADMEEVYNYVNSRSGWGTKKILVQGQAAGEKFYYVKQNKPNINRLVLAYHCYAWRNGEHTSKSAWKNLWNYELSNTGGTPVFISEFGVKAGIVDYAASFNSSWSHDKKANWTMLHAASEWFHAKNMGAVYHCITSNPNNGGRALLKTDLYTIKFLPHLNEIQQALNVPLTKSTSAKINDEIFLTKDNNFSIQLFPNPTNSSGNMNINYHLSEQSKVTIELFALSGEKISTIVNDFQSEGEYSISLNIGDTGFGLKRGMYIIRGVFENDDKRYDFVKKLGVIK